MPRASAATVPPAASKGLCPLQPCQKGIAPLDSHAAGGSYRIRSLYFDDYDDRYYYENENGTDPR